MGTRSLKATDTGSMIQLLVVVLMVMNANQSP